MNRDEELRQRLLDPEMRKRTEEGIAWVKSEEGQKELKEARAKAKKAIDELMKPKRRLSCLLGHCCCCCHR